MMTVEDKNDRKKEIKLKIKKYVLEKQVKIAKLNKTDAHGTFTKLGKI